MPNMDVKLTVLIVKFFDIIENKVWYV